MTAIEDEPPPPDAGWVSRPRTRWRTGETSQGGRELAQETPIAMTYDASTYAVMMATPCDVEDFAIGFSLTEGVATAARDIVAFERIDGELGIEARMWLRSPLSQALASRRRRIAGPTGCGLCGVDSLAEAARSPPPVNARFSLTAAQLLGAMAEMQPRQALNAVTRAVHAAAFWRPDRGVVALREDVGRHNALDKLAGALARLGESGSDGAILLTSRVSVEMVQKAAVIGSPVLVAVSAPTDLAVRTAEQAGVTLVAIARADGFEVFTHPERIAG